MLYVWPLDILDMLFTCYIILKYFKFFLISKKFCTFFPSIAGMFQCEKQNHLVVATSIMILHVEKICLVTRFWLDSVLCFSYTIESGSWGKSLPSVAKQYIDQSLCYTAESLWLEVYSNIFFPSCTPDLRLESGWPSRPHISQTPCY